MVAKLVVILCTSISRRIEVSGEKLISVKIIE